MAPSTPICKTQGKAEYGQNINLTCVSDEGSPAPTYKWAGYTVANQPRVPDPKTTDRKSWDELMLGNHDQKDEPFFTEVFTNEVKWRNRHSVQYRLEV